MMQNPFAANAQAFNVTSLSAAINILPNQYGKLGQMNLFPVKGVATRTIMVEEKNGVLNLLTSRPVGSPGAQNKSGGRNMRAFVIPHYPLDDAIMPEDVAGIRPFGQETGLESVTELVNDRLQTMKNKHDITLEFLRMGALKGIIVDGDGSTLYNLYTEFNISQKVVDFVLGTTTTKVANKCREVVRHIEDNLKGEVMNGIRAEVSQEFYDKLITHPSVEAAYANYAAAAERIGGDLRSGFPFAGITFSEYRAVSTLSDGTTTQRFIASGDGHAYPTGTAGSFQTVAAPADFNETVNTVGQLYYARQEPRKFNRGTDLHTQTNPLPICYRPGILVRIHTSN